MSDDAKLIEGLDGKLVPAEARGRRDPLVVKTVPLAGVLREFLEQQPGCTDGIVDRLAARSGVSRATISNIVWRKNPRPFTDLRHADALVAAINRPEAFYDGTLEVVARPARTRRGPGSLTGGG